MSSDGGCAIPDEIAGRMQQLMSGTGKYITTGQPDNPLWKLLTKSVSQTQQHREFKKMLSVVEWCRNMREILNRGVCGEDLNDEELAKLRTLVEGIDGSVDVAESCRRQYRTLLSRMVKGESSIFMDQHVFAKLREDFDAWQAKGSKMHVTKVSMDKNHIRAKIELDSKLPARYIHISVTVDGPSTLDTVANGQIVPHEVMDEIVEHKIEEVTREIKQNLTREINRHYWDPGVRTALVQQTTVQDDSEGWLDFKTYEQPGQALFNSKALAKVMTI